MGFPVNLTKILKNTFFTERLLVIVSDFSETMYIIHKKVDILQLSLIDNCFIIWVKTCCVLLYYQRTPVISHCNSTLSKVKYCLTTSSFIQFTI